MRFNSDNLGDSQVYNLDDVNDTETEIEADEGDLILIGVDAQGKVGIEVWAGRDEQLRPAQQASAEGRQGRNFFVNAYRVVRKGAYRIRVFAEQATVTVLKFGKNLADALRRIGEPTKATCSFCTKLLLMAMVLAFHHLAIPVAKHALGSYLLQHFQTAQAFMTAIESSFTGKALDFVYPAVEKLFDDLKSIPESVRDPLGTLAKKACQKINLCSQGA